MNRTNGIVREVWADIFKREYNHQAILYGPPGTSKTHTSLLIAASLLKDEAVADLEEARAILDNHKPYVKIVQFHPSYTYEDFVRGIEVEIGDSGLPSYKVVNKLLGQMAEDALRDQAAGRNYVLIVDEINRAPLSSVLGELIYGLEYRDQAIATPYSIVDGDTKTNRLTVPGNLFLIGTMNTADRSIGSIDYAVRRRFAFVHLPSDPEAVAASWAGSPLQPLAVRVYGSLCANVFGEGNLADASVDPDDIKIGHTYFLYDPKKCPDDDAARDYLRYRLKYQVLPVLKEYIHDGLIHAEGVEAWTAELKREDLLAD